MRTKKKLASMAIALAASLALLPGAALANGWERLHGQNAYGTMQAIVEADGIFTPETVNTVIVATGDGYWDALAAAGLAGTLKAPILITPTNSLASQTREELQRLKPKQIYVMGGPAALSESVVTELKGFGATVERAYGPTAPDTAVEIYRKGSGWSDTAIVATVNGYWDALSVAPYAYAKKCPIFLTQSDGALGQSAVDAIRANFSKVHIVGGTAAVSSAVENQLSGLDVERFAGQNAIGTSAAITRLCYASGMEGPLCVATSDGYWDALTGAPFAGSKQGVIALVSPEGDTSAADTYASCMGSNANRLGYVFGGPAAVKDDLYSYLNSYDTRSYTYTAYKPILEQAKRGEGIFAAMNADAGASLDFTYSGCGYALTREGDLLVEGWKPQSELFMTARFTITSSGAQPAGWFRRSNGGLYEAAYHKLYQSGYGQTKRVGLYQLVNSNESQMLTSEIVVEDDIGRQDSGPIHDYLVAQDAVRVTYTPINDMSTLQNAKSPGR